MTAKRLGRPKGTAYVHVALGPPRDFSPKEIRHLRKELATNARLGGGIFKMREPTRPMSQGEFAKLVGTTRAAVSGWETGESKPSGPARRLMELLLAMGPMAGAIFSCTKTAGVAWQFRTTPATNWRKS